MGYGTHITIYGALPSFCGGDDCGKILRLADHEGTVQPAWDFQVEGVPGYGEENSGQFLLVCYDGGSLSLCWGTPESDLPDPGDCGQVLTLCDDGYGNPVPTWCNSPQGLPDYGSGSCGQVVMLVDDGCNLGNPPVPGWENIPSELPEPGDCGQILCLVDDGCGNPVPAWCDMPGTLPTYCGDDDGRVLTVWESGGVCGLEWRAPPIDLANLPTSDPEVEFAPWNNDGVLSFSAGTP